MLIVLALSGSGAWLYVASDKALTHTQVKELLDDHPEQQNFVVEHPKSVEVIMRSDVCEYELVRIKKTSVIVKCGSRIATEFQNYLEYYRTYGEDMWVRNNRKSRSIEIYVSQKDDGFDIVRETSYYKKASGTAGKVFDYFKIRKDDIKIAALVESEIQQNMRLTYQVDRQVMGIFDFADTVFGSYVGRDENKFYYGDVRGDFQVDPRIILSSPSPDVVTASGGSVVVFNWTTYNPKNSTFEFGTMNSTLSVLINTTGWVDINTDTDMGINLTHGYTWTLPTWENGKSISPYRWRTLHCDNRSLPNTKNCQYSETRKIILSPIGSDTSGGEGQYEFLAFNLTPTTGHEYADAATVPVRFSAQVQSPLDITYAWVEVVVNSSGWLKLPVINTTVGRANITHFSASHYRFDWLLPALASKSSTDPSLYLFRGVACHNTTVTGIYSGRNCTYTETQYVKAYTTPGIVTAPTLSGNVQSDANVTCTAGTTNGTSTTYYFILFQNNTNVEDTIRTTQSFASFGPSYNKSSWLNCSFLISDNYTNSSWSANSTGVTVLNSPSVGYNISYPDNGQIFFLNGSTQTSLMFNWTLGSDGDDDTLYGNLTMYRSGGSRIPITNWTVGLNSTETNCNNSNAKMRPCYQSYNWTPQVPVVPGAYYLEMQICDVSNLSVGAVTATTGQCVTETSDFTIGVFDYRVRFGTGITDFVLDPSITTGNNLIPQGQTNSTGVFQVYLDGVSSNSKGLPNITMNINNSAANISNTLEIWCGPTSPSLWGPNGGFVKNTTYGSNITSMATGVLNKTAVHWSLQANTWNNVFCTAQKTSYSAISWFFGFLMDTVR